MGSLKVVGEEELICSQCGDTFLRITFNDGTDSFISSVHRDTFDSCADVYDREQENG